MLATAPTTGRGISLHVFVQPDRQRPLGFEHGVLLGPIGGLVAGLGALGVSHRSRLSSWACFLPKAASHYY